MAFFIYWIFDTLVVLRKINVLPKLDLAWISYRWAFFWTIANFSGALSAFLELIDLAKDEAKLIAKKAVSSSESGEKDSEDTIKTKLVEVRKKRFNEILNLVKSLGDSITST